MNRKFLAGLLAAALFAFGGTSTALASNYQVFSETQSFSNNGYGGAGCGAPAYEETGWKVVAGGAELTPTQLSEGDYVTDGFPANLGTEFPAWGLNVASTDGHSPGSTKVYAVCIKEPKDGATGPEGPKGETGATGATGATGPEGKEGKFGKTEIVHGTVVKIEGAFSGQTFVAKVTCPTGQRIITGGAYVNGESSSSEANLVLQSTFIAPTSESNRFEGIFEEVGKISLKATRAIQAWALCM